MSRKRARVRDEAPRCVLCSRTWADLEEAIEDAASPEFWVAGSRFDGPVCEPCTERYLHLDDDGFEFEARPGLAREIATRLSRQARREHPDRPMQQRRHVLRRGAPTRSARGAR